jgi:hypothetical protein
MDLISLRVVLFTKELCEWHGCEFGLVPGPVSVQQVFELTDLLGEMPFDCKGASTDRTARSSRRGR